MAKRSRRRGHIEERSNGTFRAVVSAGTNPLTGKRLVLKSEPVEDWDEAEVELTRLLSQVDEQKHARTNLTVLELIDKWCTVNESKQARKTRQRRDQLIRDYIAPRFEGVKAKKFTTDPKASIEFLEGYYALLQSCRFNNVRGTYHKAKDHKCEPLANSSVRAIHFILTAAFKQGLKWGYVGTNVPAMADPPGFDQPEPDPPTPEELTPLMNEAFKSLDWGLFLWLTMITGSRRGEMCVLRWTDLNAERRRLHIKRAGDQLAGEVVETTTKRKQHHHVTLDDLTMELLERYRDQCAGQCKALGVELSSDAFIFSGSPDFSTALKPNTATQRYRRAAKRHKLRSTRLHSIRHYSATELLSAGVDIKTVQGRIGHTSAATTLKFYVAWTDRADQSAAQVLAQTIPRPSYENHRRAPHAYETLAATLQQDIASGKYPVGSELPLSRDLAALHKVSVGTVSRAIGELKKPAL
ncbi:tyrosine-type recombinase/integrase [Kribbella shirazensis]|uniref:Integrase n=1 Tax=Kribbella shirazensis TaxID=1105143 RepID=A0A7X5V937_9ACTN|nr:tyrosine-type recombinase/integrase [Kribbella shirazensis]NIK56833.1 integrase [Kribbella shirazensis]